MPVTLKTTIPQITAAVARALQAVVEEAADAVVVNIDGETKRAHHGRTYPSRREPGAGHVASAPGESFATDTESLIGGMGIERFGLINWVNFADSEGKNRWAVFEFGSARMASRPTIVPVVEHMQDGFTADLAGAILHAALENETR